MAIFSTVLVLSIIAFSFNSVYEIFRDLFGANQANIISVVTLFSVVCVWFFILNIINKKRLASWRYSWLFLATVCFSLGWFQMPEVRYQRLLNIVIDTSWQYDSLKEADPLKSEINIRKVILNAERKYEVAKIRWLYENRLRKVDINYRFDRGFSVLWYLFGAFSFLMVIFSRGIVRFIDK